MTPDQLRAEHLCERANAVAAARGWSPLTIWSRPLVSTLRLTFADYVVDVTVDNDDSDVAALEHSVAWLESDCFRERKSSTDQLRAEIVRLCRERWPNARESGSWLHISEATSGGYLSAVELRFKRLILPDRRTFIRCGSDTQYGAADIETTLTRLLEKVRERMSDNANA